MNSVQTYTFFFEILINSYMSVASRKVLTGNVILLLKRHSLLSECPCELVLFFARPDYCCGSFCRGVLFFFFSFKFCLYGLNLFCWRNVDRWVKSFFVLGEGE